MVPKLILLIKRYQWFIVAFLLGIMLGLGVNSMAHDSAIVDEVAHIPAGYSYLKYQYYRLNPEHPPLIKVLAGAPLQFMKLSFPLKNPTWTTDVNGQWEAGWHFLYHDGNNAARIIFYARLPILILAIVFGFFLYRFCRQRFGVAVGLLALFFYALCPNIIAHARLVTTDLGAMAFITIAIFTYVKFLEKPSFKTGAWATIGFALAQLAKFSAVMLVPLYLIMIAVAVVAWKSYGNWKKRLWVYGSGLVILGLSSLVLIWLAYLPLTWHMPTDVQQRLVAGSLHSGWKQQLALKLVSYNHIFGIKALTQYILGVLMVFGRVVGGNTTYFLGHVSNQSFIWYFPFTYLIKTPISLLLLIIISIGVAIFRYLHKSPRKVWDNFKYFAQNHFMRLTAIIFIGLYVYTSISGNLNLGIRHLLPIFPFIFLLVAYEIVSILRSLTIKKVWSMIVIFIFMIYYAFASFSIFPSYIAYANELIGGPTNFSKYVTDSSVDWGQDLLRLQDYVKEHHIAHIAVDYFGGGEPKYYFCVRKYDTSGYLIKNSNGYDCSKSPYIEWHADRGIYPGQYMAVSETFLMNDLYYSPHRPNQTGYDQLRKMTPIAKIGYSIYVYKLY